MWYASSMSDEKSLQSLLVRHWTELSSEEGPLLKRLRQISLEKERIRRAASAAEIELPSDIQKDFFATRHQTKRIAGKTIKAAILELLATAKGMTALEILSEINSRHGSSFSRESLSPQLSRLKFEGKIKSNEGVWSLVKIDSKLE
jgi:hypothetical protein